MVLPPKKDDTLRGLSSQVIILFWLAHTLHHIPLCGIFPPIRILFLVHSPCPALQKNWYFNSPHKILISFLILATIYHWGWIRNISSTSAVFIKSTVGVSILFIYVKDEFQRERRGRWTRTAMDSWRWFCMAGEGLGWLEISKDCWRWTWIAGGGYEFLEVAMNCWRWLCKDEDLGTNKSKIFLPKPGSFQYWNLVLVLFRLIFKLSAFNFSTWCWHISTSWFMRKFFPEILVI